MANYEEARVKLTNTKLKKKKKSRQEMMRLDNIEDNLKKAFKMNNCHMNYS